MYRARLVSRLPPRLSRRRLVLPEEAGIGATPHSRANGASLRRRWGLSPAASSGAAAMSVPTPLRASNRGAAAATSRCRYRSSSVISADSCCSGRQPIAGPVWSLRSGFAA